MTFKLLNAYTRKIIIRSAVRPADDDKSSNLRVDPLTYPEIIKPLHHYSIANIVVTTSKDK